MIKKFLSGLIVILLMTVAFGQIKAIADEQPLTRKLSVEDAYKISLEGYSTIEIAKADVLKAQAKLAWANDSADDFESESADTYEKGKTKYFVPAQAKSELLLAEAKLKQTAAQLKIEVYQAYYGLIKAGKLTDYSKAAYKRADEQLKLANARYKAGAIAKNEVLEAEVQLANAKASLVDAENNERMALMKLNQMVAFNLETSLVLTSQLKYTPPSEIDINNEAERAREERYDVLQARENVKVKQIASQVASSYLGPGVYTYEEIRYDLMQAETNLREKLNLADVNIRSAYLKVLSLDQQYTLAEKSLKLANEALNLAEKRFEAGAAKIAEVTSASATLSQAESKTVDILVQYSIAKLQLDYELAKYGEEN